MADSTWIRENDARSRGAFALAKLERGEAVGIVSGRVRTVTAEDVRAAEKRVAKRRAKKRGK